MRTVLAAIMATGALAQASWAETNQVEWSRITQITKGWDTAEVRVVLDSPFQNPENCPNTGSYQTDASYDGVELANSMLLTAFALGREVQLTIDGCGSAGRPRIKGMIIRAPQ